MLSPWYPQDLYVESHSVASRTLNPSAYISISPSLNSKDKLHFLLFYLKLRLFIDAYCFLSLFQVAVFISANCSSSGTRITRCVCYQTSDGTGPTTGRKSGKSFPDLLSTGKFPESAPNSLFMNSFR